MRAACVCRARVIRSSLQRDALAGTTGQPSAHYPRLTLICTASSRVVEMQGQGDGTTSVIQIEALTRERIPELCALMHDGFGSKACCLCLSESASGTASALIKGYAKYPDEKLAVCGLAVEYAAAQEPRVRGGTVVGFCQLTLPGMPGDYELPDWLAGKLEDNEGHIDRICVSDRMRGRGIGTKLLEWADSTCRSWCPDHGVAAHDMSRGDDDAVKQLVSAPASGCITKVSLEVVHGNPAQRLYERHGYVVQSEDCCSRCCNVCCVFFLMRKCGARRMVKPLTY